MAGQGINRSVRASAEVANQVVDGHQLEARVRELEAALVASDDAVKVWGSIRLEGDAEPVLQVSAWAGGVRTAFDVPLSADVREGLAKALAGAEDDARRRLRHAVARTLAASEYGFGEDK